MSMANHFPARRQPGIVLHGYHAALAVADRIPLSLIQLGARIAVASVFWKSAQTKLASWPVTLQLFAFEYQLPLIGPELAAQLATGVELAGSALLVLGCFARIGALGLLGVTATIQIFVFPGHWAEHLMWASLLLLILARGPGFFSVDHLASRVATARGA